MKQLKRVFYFIITASVLFGCKKSELKKPTEVVFMVDINKEATMNGNLFFTDGEIVIRSLAFDGVRIKGDDVYFEKEFEGGLVAPFSSVSENNLLKFDIPQGSYTSIRIDFESEQSDFQKIKINGSYKNSSNVIVPITVEVEIIEFYDKIAKNAQGTTTIDLVAGSPSKAIIRLNPVFWFSTVASTQLDNADVTVINGVATILINSTVNSDLYDLLDDKVGSDIDITFQ